MTRKSTQSGCIERRKGWWVLRYREPLFKDGKPVLDMRGKQKRVLRFQRLTTISGDFSTKGSVRQLAQEFLKPLNDHRYAPDTIQATVRQFVQQVYLPYIKAEKRASTVHGYVDVWENHLCDRIGNYRIRSFRTVDAQKALDSLSKTDLTHTSLMHIKSVMSAIFSVAKRKGYFDGENPVRDTVVPKGKESADTYAYSLEEVQSMLKALDGVARVVVATAAYSGLSHSELRGIRWEDINGSTLQVLRSVSHGQINEPKTKARKAPVPLIPALAAILSEHRRALGNPATGWVFTSHLNTPLNLHNLVTREIIPALTQAALTVEGNHGPTTLAWHGWHAFRRALATNLDRLGIRVKTVQAILRHSTPEITQNIYQKHVPQDAVTAMNKFGESLDAPITVQ